MVKIATVKNRRENSREKLCRYAIYLEVLKLAKVMMRLFNVQVHRKHFEWEEFLGAIEQE